MATTGVFPLVAPFYARLFAQSSNNAEAGHCAPEKARIRVSYRSSESFSWRPLLGPPSRALRIPIFMTTWGSVRHCLVPGSGHHLPLFLTSAGHLRVVILETEVGPSRFPREPALCVPYSRVSVDEDWDLKFLQFKSDAPLHMM